jgi:hypothetical protein
MTNEAEFVYRPYTKDDIPFLHATWGNSYYGGNALPEDAQHYRIPDPATFHKFHRAIRNRFFNEPTATVIVCSPSDDPWHILGWIAVEVIPNAYILHYLHVKKTLRKIGIAKSLIKRSLPAGNTIFYTHITKHAAEIMAVKSKDLKDFRYLPHLV